MPEREAFGSSQRPTAHPRALGLQLVQQAHDVVGGQLHEHGRHLRMLIVAQLAARRCLHRGDEALLLAAELLDVITPSASALVNDSSLPHAILDRLVLRLVVEPALSVPQSLNLLCAGTAGSLTIH